MSRIIQKRPAPWWVSKYRVKVSYQEIIKGRPLPPTYFYFWTLKAAKRFASANDWKDIT